MPDAASILAVLDQACESHDFPHSFDSTTWIFAAARLSLFRSEADWALVFEEFSLSPDRPTCTVQTIASRLHARTPVYKDPAMEARRLAQSPHAEAAFFEPIEPGPWQDPENESLVSLDVSELLLRGRAVPLPTPADYERVGIQLRDPDRDHVFELCRYLAAVERDAVLATPQERRTNVPPELEQLLVLDEWSHLDLDESAGPGRPSNSETFHQLARVLETGDLSHYRPTEPPNTHWRHWKIW